MYKVNARIKGVAPLLQHKFGLATLETLMQGAKRQTARADYSMEWLETAYISAEGLVYQPAAHIEGCLVKAATLFKIKGRAGKSYKDAFRGYVYVTPDEVPHIWKDAYIPAPDESLLLAPTENLSISIMRVVVQRAAVARSRLQLAAGWELAFTMEVHDDQLRPEVVKDVLVEGGHAVGIGDFRPRYGRFEVTQFDAA